MPFILSSRNSIASTGFIVVLVLTFIFGRVYCSSICPLGTLQDIISRIAININRQKFFSFLKNYKTLRYSILAITIVSLFTGSFILLNLLDPFSLAGKIFSNILRIGLIPANNLAAYLLEQINIYRIYPIELKAISWIAVTFSSLVLLTIAIMSYYYYSSFTLISSQRAS